MKNKYGEIRATKRYASYLYKLMLRFSVFKQIKTGLEQAIEYEENNK